MSLSVLQGAAPIAETTPSSDVTGTSATLNGVVTSDVTGATQLFEWGPGSPALQFDGVDDVIAFSHGVIPTSGDFTVEAWAQSDTEVPASYRNILSQGQQGAAFWLGIDPSGFIRAGENWDSTGVRFPVGGWHHVALVRTANDAMLYLDGVIVSSHGGPINNPADTALFIGKQYLSYAQNWRGGIDEVRIWGVALSAAEVAAQMNTTIAPTHPKFSQLLGYWPMDQDQGGVIIDATGHDNSGTLVGRPGFIGGLRPMLTQTTQAQPLPAGNSALVLDGVNDYVDLPDGVWFDNGDLTIEAWIYPRANNLYSRVVEFGNSKDAYLDTVGLQASVVGTGLVSFNIFNSATAITALQSPNPLPLNRWSHLAATLQGTNATLFLNGIPWAKGPLAVPTKAQRTNNFLGNILWGPPVEKLNAVLDDVRIWNTALDDRTVRAWMNQPLTASHPNIGNLQANWGFNETSGTAAVDSGPNARNGDLMNGPTRVATAKVSASLSGLTPGTVYHYRQVGVNSSGRVAGPTLTFLTPKPGAGGALYFDGFNDLARIPGMGQRLPTSEVTVEFWQFTRNQAQQTTFGLDPDLPTNRLHSHVPWVDGKLYWDFGDLTGQGLGRLPQALPSEIFGSWQHFALVSSRAENFQKIYRNGVLISQKAGSSTFTPYTANLLLGNFAASLYPFTGALDEFRIWSTARSAAEIQANLNVRLTGSEAGLLACYHGDDSSGLLTDATGLTDGMLMNGAQVAPSGAPIGLPLVSITSVSRSSAGTTLGGVVKGEGTLPTRVWFEYGTNATPIPGSAENLVSYWNVGHNLGVLDGVPWFTQSPAFQQRFETINFDVGDGPVWPGGPGDFIGAWFTGHLNILESGVYNFWLTSDDGSWLYIDGQTVINNDGLHAAFTLSGAVTLTAGSHDLGVPFFENGGGANLKLEYSGPGIPRQVIPANAFLRSQPAYSGRTPTQILPVGSTPQSVSAALDDLPVGVAHYRLVAANELGTNATPDQILEVGQISSLKSMAFNGRSQFIRASLDDSEAAATHEFWFRTSEPNGGLMEIQDSSAPPGSAAAGALDRDIWLKDGNCFAYLYNQSAPGSAETISTTGLHLADSRWHHVAHVFGGAIGGQRLYVDGVLQAQGKASHSDFTWQTSLVLGWARPSGSYFIGQMDEVRIWNIARTEEEIRSTMVDRLSGDETGLIAYYRFDELDGTPPVDSSGQKHDGVLFNGPVHLPLGAPLTRPIVTTDPATPVLARTATMRGFVNPNGVRRLAAFEYGSTPALGKTTTPQSLPAVSSDRLVETPLSDLDPGATYYYRAVAYDEDGTPKFGSILSFTTLTLGCGWPISSKTTDGEVNSPRHITDAQGNLYVVGEFSGAATFKTTLKPEGGATTNAFLAKMSRGGDWVWNIHVPISAGGSLQFNSLALDTTGNVVVAGQFTGTATFGTNLLAGGSGSQLFVAKYASSGDRWLWVKAVGSLAANSANAVAVSPSDSIYVAGLFSGNISLGTNALASAGGADVWVAKLGSGGNWIWARSAGGSGTNDGANALALDADENVFVTGQFGGANASFGNSSLSSAGGDDLFVAKLSKAGSWLFARRAGGIQADVGLALAMDSANQLLLGGQFGATADFAPESNLNLGATKSHFFVAKLDPRSGSLSSFALGGEGQLTSLATDRKGKVFVTGDFSLASQLGNLPLLVSAGNRDVFVAQLDATVLEWDWALSIGASGLELGGAVSMDPAGSLAVSGTYRGTLKLGQVVLTTANDQEIFLARLDLTSTPRFEHNVWVIGQPIAVPADAQDPSRSDGGAFRLPQIALYEKQHPDSDANNSFAWNEAEHKLYAVRPVTALLKWPLTADVTNITLVATCVGRSIWPASPQIHVANSPAEVQGPRVGRGYPFRNLEFSETGGTVTPINRGNDQFQVFNATQPGYSVVKFERPEGSFIFEVVRTYALADLEVHAVAEVGSTLTRTSHTDPTGKNGYVYYEHALYDGAGEDRAYDRSTRTGAIIPVNAVSGLADDLVVVWYHTSTFTGVAWPDDPVHYLTRWPTNAAQLVIASGIGSGPLDPSLYLAKRVYSQPDRAQPGYNPNEEHAALYTDTLYALRNDLNVRVTPHASEPFVLLKYRLASSGNWAMKAYQVVTTNEVFQFQYPGLAGKELALLPPLNLLPLCAASNQAISGPWFKDYLGRLYARAAGPRGGTADIVTRFWYPLQPDFFYDLDGDGKSEAALGTCLGLLEYRKGPLSPPVDLTYHITWPDDSPSLQIGETLTSAKFGLPDLLHFAQAKVIYDDGNLQDNDPTASLIRIFDPVSERTIQLSPNFILPPKIVTTQVLGRQAFKDLPYAIRARLLYDPLNKRLSFGGMYDNSGAGEPLLLINVISRRERARILQLADGDPGFLDAVNRLFDLTRNPNQVDLDRDGKPDAALRLGLITQVLEGFQETLIGPVSPGITTNVVVNTLPSPVLARATNIIHEPRSDGFKALTAGAGGGSGYVTVVENNDARLGLPVVLHVIKVGGGPFVGDLKVIYPDNVFDEKLTLRHSADFGGNPDALEFEWYYQPDNADFEPTQLPTVHADGSIDDLRRWTRFPGVLPGTNGVNDITLGDGALSSLLTLSDNWFICRYRGYSVNGTNRWSDWTGSPGGGRAQLAEGWIKRVIRGLNPFDSRTKDFHSSAVNTFASMLQQAGPRYEGDIALNADPAAINSVGLIEAYTTVLGRGKGLSIDAVPSVNFNPANNALLLAASKISDLYVLLGNEAYSDAQDPTIGFGTSSGEYGTTASSIFAFQNQLDSLLEEELTLLRGRDDSGASVRANPVYNRLFWNFTLAEGEVAYREAYNISDVNRDGFLDEKDARLLYPQAHGDAWGHYLTSITTYYDLMRHTNFTWIPRSEDVLVAGTPVKVDFLDERKFARVAAVKAKAGAEIVNLTYRQKYVDDTTGQWQGYKDTDVDRAWGVTEWARRAGQGAIFDWVAANALLFSTDPNTNHTGIDRIDRQTVLELGEIPAQLGEIQKQLDQADIGLNPIGLAKGAVPFDIDPTFLEVGSTAQIGRFAVQGLTQFDQILERAVSALNNAVKVWDQANKATEMLRQNQDTVEEFTQNTIDQERDYKNRLIEIFGYPYAGDIGAGQTYPSGYDGPDTYHWMYVNTREIAGDTTAPPSTQFVGFFKPSPNGPTGFTYFPGSEQSFLNNFASTTLESSILQVNYPQSAAAYSFVAPASWGQRRAPGKLQEALSDVVQQEARLKQALQNYDGLIQNIQAGADLLAAQHDVNANEIQILNTQRSKITSMNEAIGAMRTTQIVARRASSSILNIASGVGKSVPKIVGLAIDVGSPIDGAVNLASAIIATVLSVTADGAQIAENFVELAKEGVGLSTDIELRVNSQRFEVLQRVKELESMMRDEAVNRLEVFNQRENLMQTIGRYRSALAEGQRLLQEVVVFRQRASSQTSANRYQDMTFRIFRNDALQKYRATFDIAARYVYLAANAYDYEVNFNPGDPRAGRDFLTDIIRQRGLGQIVDGDPGVGLPGLADPLARLEANWRVLKTQFGVINPQITDTRFSLRKELFRIRSHDDPDLGPDQLATTPEEVAAVAEAEAQNLISDPEWRAELKRHLLPDLWAVPEFRRFCRPFAPESAGSQPGILIRFPTTITFGLNYFGWPLSGGDNNYDPSQFATKIAKAGIWFSGSDGTQVSQTPRVYLIPAGMDVMRSPSGDTLTTRQWRIVDQAVPAPFPIGPSALSNPDWIPQFDSLGGTFADIRRYGSMIAKHDQGIYPDSDLAKDARLIGRSAWNSDWILVIPGGTLLNDPNAGLDAFINSVSDIKIYFQTYSYSGN